MEAMPGSRSPRSALPVCLLLAVTPRGAAAPLRSPAGSRDCSSQAIGCPSTSRAARSSDHYPCVVVANHASYLDGIILTAALPAGFTYLDQTTDERACRSPASSCGGLGSAFVEPRGTPRIGQRIARTLVNQAREGESTGILPRRNVRRSRLGSSRSSWARSVRLPARARLPVIPVVMLWRAAQAAGGSVARCSRTATRPHLGDGRVHATDERIGPRR